MSDQVAAAPVLAAAPVVAAVAADTPSSAATDSIASAAAPTSAADDSIASAAAPTSAADLETVGADGAVGADGSAVAVPKPAKKPKNKRKAPGWTQAKENPWIYVSGLPADVTDEELADHFRKVGILRTDFVTKKPKIKIYRDAEGRCKGDGSLCFLKEASVPLSITILDGVDLRPGVPLAISQAVFDKKEGVTVERSNTAPEAKKAAKLKALEQSALLSWVEDEEAVDDTVGGLKVVVLKNLFDLAEMEDPTFAPELEEDMRGECGKLGEVMKVTVFPHHPEGVVVVKFKHAGAATLCLERMNGRWFAKRKVECEFWDGSTDYSKVRAAGESEKKRLEAFGDWLEGQSDED